MSLAEVEEAFERWQDAISEHEDARTNLAAAIRRTVKEGISQSEVASILGWPRQRVNKLL